MLVSGQYTRPTIPPSRSSTASQMSSRWARGGSSSSSPYRLGTNVVTKCEAGHPLNNVSNEALLAPDRITVVTRISCESTWASLEFDERTEPGRVWINSTSTIYFLGGFILLNVCWVGAAKWETMQKRIAFYFICWICLLNGFAIGFGVSGSLLG